MAISATHASLFRTLPLPRGGSLLEIGEANWYGDVSLLDTLHGLEKDDGVWDQAKRANFEASSFDWAKAFYRATFAPSRIVSIDYHGTAAALKLDLNEPLACQDGNGRPFDVVINHGTAEHIFNIAQVFRTMHDHCADGGLMIHESPFTGWIDHGFYCLQPTLFYDLAAANNYELVLVALQEIKSQWTLRLDDRDHAARLAAAGELPNNTMLFVCFRKYGDAAFRLPMQGYYAQSLSQAGARAWRENR